METTGAGLERQSNGPVGRSGSAHGPSRALPAGWSLTNVQRPRSRAGMEAGTSESCSGCCCIAPHLGPSHGQVLLLGPWPQPNLHTEAAGTKGTSRTAPRRQQAPYCTLVLALSRGLLLSSLTAISSWQRACPHQEPKMGMRNLCRAPCSLRSGWY